MATINREKSHSAEPCSLLIQVICKKSSKTFVLTQSNILNKKSSFPFKISPVNVTKSAVYYSRLRIWSYLLKKSIMENLIVRAVRVDLFDMSFPKSS